MIRNHVNSNMLLFLIVVFNFFGCSTNTDDFLTAQTQNTDEIQSNRRDIISVNNFIHLVDQKNIEQEWLEQIQSIRSIKRYRIVKLELPTVSVLTNLDNQVNRFQVQLFPDESFTTRTQYIRWRGRTDFTWFGHVEGQPHSTLIINYKDSLILGSTQIEGHYYSIRTLDKNRSIYAIIEHRQPLVPSPINPQTGISAPSSNLESTEAVIHRGVQ